MLSFDTRRRNRISPASASYSTTPKLHASKLGCASSGDGGGSVSMKRRCASSGGEYADAARGEKERETVGAGRAEKRRRARRTELGARGLDADEGRRVEVDELPLARLHAHRVERLEVAVDAMADDVQVLEARRQLAHRRGDLVDAHLLLQHGDGEVAFGRVHRDAVRSVAELGGGRGERIGADLVARRADADDESIVEAGARVHLALVLVAVRHELEGDRRAVEVGRAAHDRRRGLVVEAFRELVRVAKAVEGLKLRAWRSRRRSPSRGAIVGGGERARSGIGAALDESFAVVEQVAVGAGVLEQDLERLGGGRGLDD